MRILVTAASKHGSTAEIAASKHGSTAEIAASKHGSTAEIAASIGQSLEELGHDVAVVRPTDVRTLDGYAAVVIGSAIYEGRWLGEARAFVREHAIALERMPVWLFSSGPLGDPPKPAPETVDVSSVEKAVLAMDHRVFPGRLLKHDLGFVDRAIATAFRAPDGDFRPWSEIDGWARDIAGYLAARATPPPNPEPVAA
jgi:menaquinone-dependent protoporphyrinogen oxidase